MALKGVVKKGDVITLTAENSPASPGHVLVAYHFVRKSVADPGDGMAIAPGAKGKLVTPAVPDDAIKLVVTIDLPEDAPGSVAVSVTPTAPQPTNPPAATKDATWTYAVIA